MDFVTEKATYIKTYMAIRILKSQSCLGALCWNAMNSVRNLQYLGNSKSSCYNKFCPYSCTRFKVKIR